MSYASLALFRYSLIASIALLGVSGFCADTSPSSGARSAASDQVESIASDLPFLPVEDILWNRGRFRVRAADSRIEERYLAAFEKLTRAKISIDELEPLLAHQDPKIRTVVLCLLFCLEDPQALPLMVRHAGDQTPTFDGHPELDKFSLSISGAGPPQKEQTVGYFAEAMVAFYMKEAGFSYGIKHATEPDFAEYWDARSRRAHCASWFSVQLARASHGTYPTQIECKDNILRVRRRIDQMPPADRAWTLLWLNGEEGSDLLMSESDLVQLCKGLGPDELLKLLGREIFSDDPDLDPRKIKHWPFKRMCVFVLKHAKELLRRSDADTLIRFVRTHRPSDPGIDIQPAFTAQWWIASATLDGSNASEVLHDGWERLSHNYTERHERTDIAIALLELVGKSEVKFVTDWFYTKPRDVFDWSGTPSKLVKTDRDLREWSELRGLFIQAARNSTHPHIRIAIASIIRDKRFDKTDDWYALEQLILLINRWQTKPIVTEDEMRSAGDGIPNMSSEFLAFQKQLETKYPGPTKALRAVLSEWRTRIRASIPIWLPRESLGQRSGK